MRGSGARRSLLALVLVTAKALELPQPAEPRTGDDGGRHVLCHDDRSPIHLRVLSASESSSLDLAVGYKPYRDLAVEMTRSDRL